MGRPRTSDKWRERIRFAYAAAETTGEKSSAAAIARELESLYPDCPSRRTIQRIIEDFKQLPDDARREYSVFRWPQSMEQDALPWDASRELLDLQRHLRSARWGGNSTGIPVRFARWYWRACQAMPDADIDRRIDAAARLTYWEISGLSRQEDEEALHWYLVYSEWSSPEHRERYEKAIKSTDVEPMFLSARFLADYSAEWDEVLGLLGNLRLRRKEGKSK